MGRECTHCGHINSNMRQAICPRCVQPYGRDSTATPGPAAAVATAAASGAARIGRSLGLLALIAVGAVGAVLMIDSLAPANRSGLSQAELEAQGRDRVKWAAAATQAAAEPINRAIEAQQVLVGMTADQARLAWGEPYRINATTTALGTSEQWVYQRGHLYLDAGIVRSVQTSR
jgi:hypothetical protein